MQKEENSNGSNESPVRVLNSRALLFHNAHLKSVRRRDPKCGFCQTGVGAIVKEVERPEPEPELDKDNRDNEERDSAFTPRSLWDRESEG